MGSSAPVNPQKTNREIVLLQESPTVKIQQKNNQEVQETNKPLNTNTNSNKIDAKTNQISAQSIQNNEQQKPKKSLIDKYISDSMQKSPSSVNKSRINQTLTKKNLLTNNSQSQQPIVGNKKQPNKNSNINSGSPIRMKSSSHRTLDKHMEKESNKSTHALKALNMKLIATEGGTNANITRISSSTTHLPSSKITLHPLSSSKKITVIHESKAHLANSNGQKQSLSLPKIVHPVNESDKLINSKVKNKSNSKLKKIDAKINQLVKLYGIYMI